MSTFQQQYDAGRVVFAASVVSTLFPDLLVILLTVNRYRFLVGIDDWFPAFPARLWPVPEVKLY